jgi:AraC family transcriptional regulator
MFRRKIKPFHLPSITVAGLELITDSIMTPDFKYEESVLPALWEDFWAVFPKLGIKTTGKCFGVAIPLDQTTNPGKTRYMAGVEFDRGVPHGLDFNSLIVPAGNYVRFTHRGLMETLKESYVTAYTEWFPSLNMEMRNAPHLEVYDERFIPTSPKCEMDILIPVK